MSADIAAIAGERRLPKRRSLHGQPRHPGGHHLRPASRYWPFQWIETGIFLALALALTGICFSRLGRRRT